MSTPSRDLVDDYGRTPDFDRLLATPRTIVVCWCVSALLLLAASLPVALDATRALVRDVVPWHDRLAHAASPLGGCATARGAPAISESGDKAE
jgi:hypothetical protein